MNLYEFLRFIQSIPINPDVFFHSKDLEEENSATAP